MRALWAIAVVSSGYIAGSVLPLVAAPVAVSSVCASTPAAALASARELNGANTPVLAEAHGYRVESIRWDPLQRQSWAVIESCDHKEQPAMTMLLKGAKPLLYSSTHPGATIPIVRAGDVVHLWKRDPYAHIEMIAVAEENGVIGTRIRLRLAQPHDVGGEIAPPQYLAGVVRGPADVEMEP